MATPELPLGYLDEGRAYLEAVQKLGLRPNAFFWAFDRVTNGFVLVLVTEAFDAVGPFELSKLLFKAYNARATPQAIDPFIIRLHSTDHHMVREMDRIMAPQVAAGAGLTEDCYGPTKNYPATANIDDLYIEEIWVYVCEAATTTRSSASEVLRRFHRFERTINGMAP